MLIRKFFALLFLSMCTTADAWHPNDSRLRAEGEKFREQVIKQFTAQSDGNFQLSHDLTSLCKQANLEGKTKDELEAILKAAGGKPLIDIRTLDEQVRKASKADFLGGFNVGASSVGKTDFVILLRVTNLHGMSTVKEVTSCSVTSVFL